MKKINFALVSIVLFFASNANALTYREISLANSYLSTCTSPISGIGANTFNIKVNLSAAISGSNTAYGGATRSTGTIVIPKSASLAYILIGKSKKDYFKYQDSIMTTSPEYIFKEYYDVETKYTSRIGDVIRLTQGNISISYPTPYASAIKKSKNWLANAGKNRLVVVGKVKGNRFNGSLLVYRLTNKTSDFYFYKVYTLTCK
jgi:hypothetical protein